MASLYVVATPIGNLRDMTPRAVETLKNVALIAAEDTRVTAKLARHFGILTPMTSYHRHNEQDKTPYILAKITDEGLDVALVSDAGTPGISDPGHRLTAACRDKGIPVIAIPGASAVAAALSVSGMAATEFAFYGFLPREKKALREKLTHMSRGISIAVVYESPRRIVALMETLHALLPDTMVSLSHELTKLHETTLYGTTGSVLEQIKQNAKADKGEYCAILQFKPPVIPKDKVYSNPPEAELVKTMLGGLSLREAQIKLVEAGVSKNAAYRAGLRLKELFLS